MSRDSSSNRAVLRHGFFLALVLSIFPVYSHADSLVFLSTQLTPVEESAKMRRNILEGFPGEVDFQPVDNRHVFLQIASGTGDTRVRPGLLGGLHGDFLSLAKSGILGEAGGVLRRLESRVFFEKLVELGRMGGNKQIYIPWMQATYIMAANRKALKYLPKGADINSLTYNQLVAWGANIKDAVGEPKIGFPAGRNGLMHRFLEGYLYPSYTGGTVRGFRASETKEMWEMMRRLWGQTTPRSLIFGRMYEPLLSGEVWLAWDHTARIMPALKKRPGDFVVYPAPSGPKGRGFMVVLVGLAIPVYASDPGASAALIDYLTRTDIQVEMLRNIGFFPVVLSEKNEELDPELVAINGAVARQAKSPDALPALLPAGLGDKGRYFNSVYSSAFTRIVLRGKDIETTLDKQAEKLSAVLAETGAPCWPPDAASDGPCPVE